MVVKIENLVKRYGDLVAVDHFNLEIEEGRDLRTSGTERQRQVNNDPIACCLC